MKIYAADVNYSVKVSGVEITPDPVVRARPVTFKISAATGNSYLLYLHFIMLSLEFDFSFFHAGIMSVALFIYFFCSILICHLII